MSQSDLPLLPLLLADVPAGLKRALLQEGVPWRSWRPGLPDGRFILFDSRRRRSVPVARGQIPIDVDSLRPPSGGDPFSGLTDSHSGRFGWRIGEFLAVEEVARVDKREVRRQVLAALRRRLEQQGGVWLRVAAYPFPFQGVFNFRIDYDEFEARDFQAVRDAISGHEHGTSHFVCGASYDGAAEALDSLRGLDVGSHGYHHHTYRTVQENVANVRRGIAVLRRHGFEPSGFAAPHGRFNGALLAALEQEDAGHSSEFALGYDDLPYFVGRSDLVQIPIHPVSLGIVLEAARQVSRGDPRRAAEAAAEATIDHFCRFIDRQARLGEPALLYGHPTRRLGRYPQVLLTVFQHAEGLGSLWKTTLSEWARWWRFRSALRLVVRRRSDTFLVTAGGNASGYRLGIEYVRGRHVALIPLAGDRLRFSPHGVGYQNRSAPAACRPVRVDKPRGLRQRVERLIDWEKVTPVEEIRANGLRNWAKRALRRLARSR